MPSVPVGGVPGQGEGVSLQTDHLIGTSAHAPQGTMVTYTGMGLLGPGPHGLLRHWVLDESRSFFRVHTGYFSNIPKCIKAEFIASWACSQSSVVSSSKR
ncbi:hypothetical protein TNCV_1824811 [Trichonephila clavipes]|nr:hypothetical protein TNCV_1824811 [Trichonephila clavipes]